ncbi:MAG: acyl carrier protein [Candidatus Omnitrophica bacterium CG12_big_fil_rev_8_21_14_0_65_45_16]|nr:MAG: acyl carrier protein [Candidatus Omnitrophica bacterium CG12_big_fil_rev_8_21_14_0_65_45_16]
MDIRNSLNEIFREVFRDPTIEIYPEMTANDVRGWDSLNHITLIYAIEKKFCVSFTIQEVAVLKNVGDLLGLLKAKLPNAL